MAQPVPDVIGRYQILRTIGEGGMGKLYLARDPDIERNVAIKVLREGLDDPELRERFAREARSAGRLQHINIVTIFDVGKHLGQPFIAMEFVKGETLDRLLKTRRPMSLGKKVQIMEDLCAGLHYAHKAGVVHRDIKPGNIVIADDGILKILDFGIARLGGSGMTQAGMVMGTLNYMPPEQMEGRPVDARADMFSAGAVFYELLSYQLAFPGDLRTGIVVKILSGQPDPLERLVPNIDPGIVALISRCLEKQPDKRFPDMASVKRELGNLRRRLALEDEEELEEQADLPTIVSGPVPLDVPKTLPAQTPAKPSAVESVRDKRMRIRADQLQAHISRARRAIELGDHRAVLEACHEALVLDPENVEANDLEGRARAALDEQQLDQWLGEARDKLDRGDLTMASSLVDQALGLNKHSPDAIALRKSVAEAKKQQAAEQLRAREFADALAQAQRELAAGALDAAAVAVNRALELQPSDTSARTVKDRINGAVAAKKRAEEMAQARQVVNEARQQFAAGDHAKAIEKLESIESGSTIVGGVLAELRREADEIERRRLAAEAAQKKEEESKRLATEAARKKEEERLAAEAARKAEEDARRLAAEAARKKDEEEQRRLRQTEEARRREDEEARRLAEAARKKDEEAQRVAAAAARKKEEEERRQAAEAARKAEDDKRRAAEEEKRLATEAARKKEEERLAAEAARLAAEAARKAEDGKRRAAEEEKRLATEAARKREEERLAAEAARQASAALAEARTSVERGQFDAALKSLGKVRKLDPAFEGIAEVNRAIETGRAAAEAADETRREIEKLLARASKAVKRQEWQRALEPVAEALRLDATHREATALKKQIDEALARERAAAASPEADDQATIVARAPVAEDLETTIQARLPRAARESVDATVQFPAAAPVPAPAERVRPVVEPVAKPSVQEPAGNKKLMMMVGGAIAALLIVGVLVVPRMMRDETTTTTPGTSTSAPGTTTPSGTPGAPGRIVLNITPWATIDAITRKSDGQRVGAPNIVTPAVVDLPPGDYHVRATNPSFSQPLEFDLTVAAGAVQEVRRAMPDLRPEEEITRILTQ